MTSLTATEKTKTRLRKHIVPTLGFTLTALAAGVAQAADSTLQEQVNTLDQQLKVLQRKVELSDEVTTKAKTDNATVTASDKGFGFKSADGQFEIKLRGLIQADARVFEEGIKGQPANAANNFATTDATDNFLLRRVRPIIDGKVNETYSFRISSDFGNGSSSLVDAYVDGSYDTAAKVRVGKFTPPVGFERLQSSADTKFNELSLVSNFLPSRDVGVQLSGDVFEGVLSYAAGLFNGANDGASGDNDADTDKEVAARLFVQPLINHPGLLQGLGFGLGYTHTQYEGALTPAAAPPYAVVSSGVAGYRTSGQETFFSYANNGTPTTVNTVIADGDRDRFVPQFSYYYGGLGLTGEYAEQAQEIAYASGVGARSEEVDNRAWNVTASYVITGEEASSKGIKPTKIFDPRNGGWGAWEVKARAGELVIDGDVFRNSNGVLATPGTTLATNSFADARRSAKSAENFGVGVNWYLNNFVRVSADYEETRFEWGGGGTTAAAPKDRPDEKVFIGRVQVSF